MKAFSGMIGLCIVAALLCLFYSSDKFRSMRKPKWFCLGGVEYFDSSHNPIYDKNGDMVECEEGE